MQAHNKLLLGAAIALAGAGALNGNAFARTVIYADLEPPAVRVETVPAARPPSPSGWRPMAPCSRWSAPG